MLTLLSRPQLRANATIGAINQLVMLALVGGGSQPSADLFVVKVLPLDQDRTGLVVEHKNSVALAIMVVAL